MAYFIAHYMGIFKKHGIKSELVVAQSGSVYTSLLESGQLDIGTVDIPGIISVNKKGGNLRAVGSLYDHPTDTIICRNDVTGITTGWPQGVKTLEGHTVGVFGPAPDVTVTLLNYSMVSAGADPAKVKLVYLPGISNYIAAFQSKRVDCEVAEEPIQSVLKDNGSNYKVVLAIKDPKGPPIYQKTVFGVADTTATYAAAHPQVIKNFLAAMSDAMTLAKNPANAEKIANAVAPAFPGVGRSTLVNLVKIMGEDFGTHSPYINQEEFNNALTIFSKAYGEPKPNVTYSETVYSPK
jgi:NitT/TauT family transport system substrate-binding protein